MSETPYQQDITLAAPYHRMWLYRNNVGAWKTKTGRLVRYGLKEGSADLIGWTEVTVTPAMVGRTIAVFTSIECKGATTDKRKHQEAWRAGVLRSGGIGLVMREGRDDINETLARVRAEMEGGCE